jgi:hypothetical protein
MARILLTRGKEVLLDQLDYNYHAQWLWSFGTDKYARRGHKATNTHIYLHVEIAKSMGIWIPGRQVDHRNLNRLDCQRTNLRIATNQQNSRNKNSSGNTSPYIGVSWYTRTQQWVAKITVDNHGQGLGYFDYDCCAAEAYNIAAINLFKEFAQLNVIEHRHD